MKNNANVITDLEIEVSINITIPDSWNRKSIAKAKVTAGGTVSVENLNSLLSENVTEALRKAESQLMLTMDIQRRQHLLEISQSRED